MKDKYKGMTVNEALYVSGLYDKFYKTVNEKDLKKVKEILLKIELNEESIKPILESFDFED